MLQLLRRTFAVGAPFTERISTISPVRRTRLAIPLDVFFTVCINGILAKLSIAYRSLHARIATLREKDFHSVVE